ncbi:MAG: carbonic anhydrase [Pirellulales bacterium]
MTQRAMSGERDPARILAELRAGNERFVRGQTVFAHEGAEWRKQLVAGQQPFATILGCSDSRVPIELVFDQGFGDLFVIRVAGNVMAPSVAGSVEYAVEHLRTPVVVVLGHEQCGAVTAALAQLPAASGATPPTASSEHEPASLQSLLREIKTGLAEACLPESPPERRLKRAVELNVRWTLKQLRTLPRREGVAHAERTQYIGAVYELDTGRVRFLED